MATGNQNEIKKKLDELKEIPEGFHFDPESTWQKLEAKLESRPAKKRRGWFYAAAILFFVFAASLFFFLNKSGKKYNAGTVTKIISPVEIKKDISSEQVKTNTVPVPLHEKEKKMVPLNRVLVKSSQEKEILENQGIVIRAPLDSTVANKPIPAAGNDSAAAISSTTKTKFRIAHINELNGQEIYLPVQEPPATRVSLSFTKKGPVILYETPPAGGDDKTNIPKKPRTLLSFFSSSQ